MGKINFKYLKIIFAVILFCSCNKSQEIQCKQDFYIVSNFSFHFKEKKDWVKSITFNEYLGNSRFNKKLNSYQLLPYNITYYDYNKTTDLFFREINLHHDIELIIQDKKNGIQTHRFSSFKVDSLAVYDGYISEITQYSYNGKIFRGDSCDFYLDVK